LGGSSLWAKSRSGAATRPSENISISVLALARVLRYSARMNHRFLALVFSILWCLPCLRAEEKPAARAERNAPTMHKVTLQTVGENEIAVIKVIRDAVPSLGLADARKLVNTVPALITETTASDAMKIRRNLQQVGATVAIAPPLPEGTTLPKATHRVMLEETGEKKISVIKVVKDVTGLGLAECKKMVESTPVAVIETDEMAAKRIVKDLEANGAHATAEPIAK